MTDPTTTVPSCVNARPMSGYDVVVCGAGPAGIGAAVAAGRMGARVLLLERLFCVGGMGATTPVHTWCDTPGGPIFDDLERRVAALGKATRKYNPQAHTCRLGRCTLHGETVKAVALRLLNDAAVKVLFGATVCGAQIDAGRVTGVLAALKGELVRIPAKVVVDATADADVAAAAGAAFETGDPSDGRLMHVNFMYQLGGVDAERYRAAQPDEARLLDLIRQAHQAGTLRPPRGAFRPAPEHFPYHIPEKTLALTSWEIEGVNCSNPDDVSATVVDCQLRALEMVEFCRANLPGYERCEIARFWDVLGTRESRRLRGRYTLTGADVLRARKFADGIARACFFIDFHDSPPGRSIPYNQEFRVTHSPPLDDWYEIPYRCLLPESLEGLLVAGRCISATREGIASMRVMPTCMFVGQAAGTAAALAVTNGVAPHQIHPSDVRRRLGLG